MSCYFARMYKKYLLSTLFLMVLVAGVASTAVAAQPAEIDSIEAQYRVLEWEQLIPEGWEAPLIAPAHDEARRLGADKTSLVAALDQQLITLPGYIKPIVFEESIVSEFLLVPFLPHHMKQHTHLDSNQMVYVSLAQPIEVTAPFDPIWVVGTITLGSVDTDEGPVGYRIDNALATNYEY